MSDSLRDQLLKAGFKEAPASQNAKKNTGAKKNKKSGKSGKSDKSKSNKTHRNAASNGAPRSTTAAAKSGNRTSAHTATAAGEDPQVLAQKKALKEKIRTLIEENRVKDHAGEEVYSYQVGSRVRQLFVKPEHRQSLSDGKLVITRLNGNTYLIDPETASQVLALNPDWAVITNQPQKDTEDPAYAEYQIPDDLSW